MLRNLKLRPFKTNVLENLKSQ